MTVISFIQHIFIFLHIYMQYMNNDDPKKLKLILAVTPTESESDIKSVYSEKGFVEAVCYVADKVWDRNTRQLAGIAIKNRETNSEYYKLLYDAFNIKKHFSIVNSHRVFIKMAYNRLGTFVPNMTSHQADTHDLTKYELSQSIGYTARWVHMVSHDNECWRRGLNDHYSREPHHPQFYPPGNQMSRKFLEESLIDMVASRWERQLNGNESVTNRELVTFDPVYLKRYVQKDFIEVEYLIETIKQSSQ